jgi:hypothetical protein
MPAHRERLTPLRRLAALSALLCLMAASQVCRAQADAQPAPEAGSEAEVRLDIFEMLYAYEVAGVDHGKIVRHNYHWVFWDNDTIWPIFDNNPQTWIETDPDEGFVFTLKFNAPVKVTKIAVSTAKMRGQDRVQPFKWALKQKAGKGQTPTLCEGEVRVEGEYTVPVTSPSSSRTYIFIAQAIDDDGQPAQPGQCSLHITGVDLYAPQETAYLWASPAQALTFDKKFLPFVTTPGQLFDMRVWKITNAGLRTEDATGVEWSSSNQRVATVDDQGCVKAIGPGEATIRAGLSPGVFDEVPVKVIPEKEGKLDLDLIWVERWIKDKDGNLVKRDWDAEVTQPQPGESLVWHAHIINVGEKTTKYHALHFTVDGKPTSNPPEPMYIEDLPPAGPLVETGEKVGDVPLLRHKNERVVEFLEMPFDGKRHTIEVTLSPNSMEGEDANPDNNTLTVWSDAITLGYYMSETSYHGFGAIQPFGAGDDLPEDFKIPYADSTWGIAEWNRRTSTSYDRLQRILRVFNHQFTISKHPLTPDGITERINGEVYIIPDPDDYDAVFGINGHRFGKLNKTIDLIWSYVTDTKRSWAYFKYDRLQDDWRRGGMPYMDVCMIHEVSHARYLIDIYGSNLWCKDIHILNPDGTRAFPDEELNAYDLFARVERHTPEQYEQAEKRERDGHLKETISGHGNMVGGMGYADGWCEHCAYSWERIRGRRARSGTWNASPELGEFLNVIPERNIILVQTPDGAPCADARIELFRSEHDKWHKGIYAKVVDNVPDVERTTDPEGKADLGPMPFGTPREDDEYGYHAKGVYGYNGRVNAVLRITVEGKAFYKFFTVFDANLGYWYKYGLEAEGWPHPQVRPDSELVYVYTIDPAWSAEEEMRHRGQIPTTY